MRIVIDMQGAQTGSRLRGIGRYTLSLVHALARNRREHEVFLVLNGMMPLAVQDIRDHFHDVLPQSHILVWHAVSPVAFMQPGNQLRRQVALQLRDAFLASLQPDVVLIASMIEGYHDDAVQVVQSGGIPTVAVFYDAIPLLNDSQYLKPDALYRDFYLQQIKQFKDLHMLLAISESARIEAMNSFGIPSEKVVNTSAAVGSEFRPRDYSAEERMTLANKYGLTKSFILYTGASDERKNQVGLIRAFAALPATLRVQYQLVLAGGLPQEHHRRFEHAIRREGLTLAEVRIIGRVQDAELLQLYNTCYLFVFPSMHEGFGLPALEAMSCGAAVIGSNASSVPEVIGLEEALFDPTSISSMASKMEEVLSDREFHQRLKLHALNQAAKFSWDRSARLAWNAMARFTNHSSEEISSDFSESSTLFANETFADQMKEALIAGDQTPDALNPWRLVRSLAMNLRERPKQLLVDISELVQRDARTGIQRVVNNVLNELLRAPPASWDVKPVYKVLQDQGGYRYANRFLNQRCMDIGMTMQCQQEGLTEDAPIDYGNGDVFLALDLQHRAQLQSEHQLRMMRNQGVHIAFVVYDLLPVQMSEYFPVEMAQLHHAWLNLLARVADSVYCISATVAYELKVWLRNHSSPRRRPLHVSWFHMGADMDATYPAFCPESSSCMQTVPFNQQCTTFLMVGTIEPRKGHEQVLDSFEYLWQKGADINLVFVGKPGWNVNSLLKRMNVHPENGRRFFWLKDIDDAMLNKVYETSDCLIAASYGEGFGLPLIEAAQKKIPLIVRDIPVFREIAKDCAYYFSAKNSMELAGNLTDWMERYRCDEHPRSEGIVWQTWAQSTQQLIQKMQSHLEDSSYDSLNAIERL